MSGANDAGTAVLRAATANPSPSPLQIALDLAARGIPSFPCGANKRPAIPEDEDGHGFLDATADPDALRALFARAPHAKLVGMPTGVRSGIDILDSDPRHGGHLWEAAHAAQLPETLIHQTGGGGRHRAFQHAEGVTNRAGCPAPGVDIRGEGGYAIWPPSRGYSVINDVAIAPWPVWLLELVRRPTLAPRPERVASDPSRITDKRLAGLVRSLLGRVSHAPEGLKHDTLLRIARTLGGYAHLLDYTEAQLVGLLLDALPDTVEDWKNAEKTALDGLRHGAQSPLTLEERPQNRTQRGDGSSNGTSQTRSTAGAGTSQTPPPGGPGRSTGGGGGRVPPAGGPDGEVPTDPEGGVDGARADEPAELPVIMCEAGKLHRMAFQAEDALIAAKVPIYQRTILVRPASIEYPAAAPSGSKKKRKTHSAALIPLTAPYLLKTLSQVAIFKRFDGRAKKIVVCDPPAKIVDILLASRGDWRFPVVRGILTTPTLRPDGSLLTTPGYDPESRYYLMFPSDLVLPDIPEGWAPTREDALASHARLDALLDGYPFEDNDGVDGVSRAVAHCMLMTQVLRCAMGMSPMLSVSARSPGTGKSHLVDLASTIAIGRYCPVMTAGKNDEEAEKGLNTMMMSGVPGFSIDNVHRILDLAVLNTATERPMITIRKFGVLENVEVENGVVVYQTGNNLDFGFEQIRRTVLSRMDAGIENPEQRPFGSDPINIVLSDRGRYVLDVLTIPLAYLAHLAEGGHRPNIPPFGSYPDWSRLVREPLCWLGQPDPILSQKAASENSPERNKLRDIVGAWYQAFGLEAHTLADAIQFATTVPVWLEHRGESPGDRQDRLDAHTTDQENRAQLLAVLRATFPAGKDDINTHLLGNWIRKLEGRPIDGLKLVKVTDADGKPILEHGAVQWRLRK